MTQWRTGSREPAHTKWDCTTSLSHWVARLPGREASWNKRTDTPSAPMKRPSSKPSPRKNGSSNTQTTTSQIATTNWTGQSRLFCSGWELDTTDLTPTCTTNSRLASLRCAHAMQTSWLQNIYCSIVHYMMLWGGTHGRNQCLWGTSSMATWRSWGGQPPSWGQQASPSSVRQRRLSDIKSPTPSLTTLKRICMHLICTVMQRMDKTDWLHKEEFKWCLLLPI